MKDTVYLRETVDYPLMGVVHVVWHTSPPALHQRFRVLREDWLETPEADDWMVERHIYEWQPV